MESLIPVIDIVFFEQKIMLQRSIVLYAYTCSWTYIYIHVYYIYIIPADILSFYILYLNKYMFIMWMDFKGKYVLQ